MTLQQLCEYLGWNVSELARQSDIDWHTAHKAIFRNECSSRVALKIVEALNARLARDPKLQVGDIQGLTVKD